jgi:hypothetical protein
VGRTASAYRTLLFFFLLLGETCALAGASGVLRGHLYAESAAFQNGVVAESYVLSDLIAAGTGAGLVGGFVMIAVLAAGGPGWLVVDVHRERTAPASEVPPDEPTGASLE